jgi:hypothetical protein
MRITGFVNVNGTRMPLDWRINGISISSGPGVSADDVKVITELPNLAKAEKGGVAPIEEVVTSRWDALTVTELRVELERLELPVSGNKTQLIQRLVESNSSNEESKEPELVEEPEGVVTDEEAE